jgi:hypothetical protein
MDPPLYILAIAVRGPAFDRAKNCPGSVLSSFLFCASSFPIRAFFDISARIQQMLTKKITARGEKIGLPG